MTMKPTHSAFKHIIAFEVAKEQLVIHTWPADQSMTIANTRADIRRLLKAEKKRNHKEQLGTLLVVCEATGGYERHVLDASTSLNLKVHRAHGSRVRFFAKYLGLAKTDPIDARVLGLYGARTERLHLYRPPSPEEKALQELKTRRDQIQAMLIAERNRMEHVGHASVVKNLKAHIAGLGKTLSVLESEIANLVSSHNEFARQARLMRSVKGIGPVTTATLLAQMPELGRLTKGEAARLAGLAPMNQDSGKTRGHRHIEPGRVAVRRCLYMAALVAMQHNPVIKAFAARLKAQGKTARVVITAIMRRLIVILNGVLKSGKPWRGAQHA